MKNFILAIDQGTTSTRAVLYDAGARRIAERREEFRQHFPRPGWVEHDPEDLWNTTLATLRGVLDQCDANAAEVAAAGITNQRETVVVWDRAGGRAVAPAIVWQDRRTAPALEKLKSAGHEQWVAARTGLLLDPYFSASKLAWILDHTPGLRERARNGELAAGTVDSWLAFRLSAGRVHVTDPANASRTMLMDLRSCTWDPELLDLFGIPAGLLPEIVPTSGVFGAIDAQFAGAEIPLTALVGDQQAALFGQRCLQPGMAKCTYGTGCFLLMQTGAEPVASSNRLLTTVAWKLGSSPPAYALEGAVFVGGAAIQWLRDGLGLIRSAEQVSALAARVADADGVVVVPAFTGLGAPYWDPTARGAVFGITRATSAAHIARATLDGIAFQVADVLRAMEADCGRPLASLRVDGGASASDLLLQIQADQLGIGVERPPDVETTALGAALLAGLGAGVWSSPAELPELAGEVCAFQPAQSAAACVKSRAAWDRAVLRAQNWDTT